MLGRPVCCLAAGAFLFSIVSGAAAAGPRDGAAARVQGHRLYLNVGVQDTRRLPNLMAERPAAFAARRAYVVQFDGPMTPGLRKRLASAGVKLGDYLPANAFVADLAAAAPEALAGIREVRWVGEFRRAWKLDPQLGRRTWQTAERRALAQQGKSAVVVTLFRDREAGTVVRALRAIEGAVVHGVDTVAGNATVRATIPSDRAAALAELDDVQYVEDAPEITLRNSTTRWIVQSNVTNVTPFYDNGIRGEGQVVGIMDGKINVTHCSFSDVNPIGPTHRKILAYNTSQGSDTHGTHVAGTAVGDAGANDNTRGIAYLGKLVFDDIPAFTEAGMFANLQQHHNQGARVHTNSWGDDGTTSYNSLTRGIDSFSHSFEDSLVLFAVTNTSTLKNPENAKNLLAVGASQDTPSQGSFCSGGQGPTADGRRKPEIFAPGCSTNSAQAGSSCSTTALTGTSMASPAVAGTAMLVRQYYTDGYYPSGTANAPDAFTPSGALVKATLINSAADMTGIAGYPSNQEGWGRVLADNAAFFAGDARSLAVLDDVRNADGLTTVDPSATYSIQVLGSTETLRVTLVWTDAPASASTGTGFAAVNDLDLEVEAPGGALFLGNVFAGGFSTTGGTRDDRNNVEQVHVNNPQTGFWTLRVKPTAVNVGAQGYALVATGDIKIVPPDCNGNGTPDPDDIAAGTSTDCNSNSIPDECETPADCNTNGTNDLCDISEMMSVDCNGNSIPDECELATNDCNGNGLPDECESTADCNNNGTLDICDLVAGTSEDCNDNRTPDECELDSVEVFLETSFDGGIPAGWTAGGLWHATSGCVQPGNCDPAPWAYYGQDSTCNFDTGSTTTGVLEAPAVTLPANLTSATLTYCSIYQGESGNSNSGSGWDWAWLSVNNVERDDVSAAGDQGAWEVRTVDLTNLAGQTITLRWHFNSRDNVANSELGWQIDNVRLEAVVIGGLDCNANGTPDECDVARGSGPDCNRNGVPDECEAAVPCPCGTTVEGDLDVSFLVDGKDVGLYVPCRLGGDPTVPGCECADFDHNGAIDDLDTAMFMDCLLGVACP